MNDLLFINMYPVLAVRSADTFLETKHFIYTDKNDSMVITKFLKIDKDHFMICGSSNSGYVLRIFSIEQLSFVFSSNKFKTQINDCLATGRRNEYAFAVSRNGLYLAKLCL